MKNWVDCNKISVFFCRAKANILGYFWLALVVDEGKGVMPRVASVEESPPFTRIYGVVVLVA